MKKVSSGGVGALAFLVLVVVAVFAANPPGGTYKASDVVEVPDEGSSPGGDRRLLSHGIGVTRPALPAPAAA